MDVGMYDNKYILLSFIVLIAYRTPISWSLLFLISTLISYFQYHFP